MEYYSIADNPYGQSAIFLVVGCILVLALQLAFTLSDKFEKFQIKVGTTIPFLIGMLLGFMINYNKCYTIGIGYDEVVFDYEWPQGEKTFPSNEIFFIRVFRYLSEFEDKNNDKWYLEIKTHNDGYFKTNKGERDRVLVAVDALEELNPSKKTVWFIDQGYANFKEVSRATIDDFEY